MTRAYVIHPGEDRGATLGLLPGIAYWKTQLTKNGPWVAVKTEVVEPRNEAGEIDGDCTYRIFIAGNEVPWDRWGNGRMTLIGEQIAEPEYNYVLKALEWDKVNLGHDERKAVDLMAMPPVPPPVKIAAVGCIPPGTEVEMLTDIIFFADTPAASALADAVLPPIDVEIDP